MNALKLLQLCFKDAEKTNDNTLCTITNISYDLKNKYNLHSDDVIYDTISIFTDLKRIVLSNNDSDLYYRYTLDNVSDGLDIFNLAVEYKANISTELTKDICDICDSYKYVVNNDNKNDDDNDSIEETEEMRLEYDRVSAEYFKVK
jgi:hypothetical protein